MPAAIPFRRDVARIDRRVSRTRFGMDVDATRPPNFRWIAPGRLAGSARPASVDHVAYMARIQIGAVVSAVPVRREVAEAFGTHGIEHLSLPIEDYSVPSDAQIRQFLAFVKAYNDRGIPVLVHCYAGIGRTGTLGALYLVADGVSAQEALDRVGVESLAQTALVYRWELQVRLGL